MQQGINQHGAMPVGQHKAVPVEPVRVAGVVAQKIPPQYFGNVSHAHGRSGMAGFGFLYSIHAQDADGIGAISTRVGVGHSKLLLCPDLMPVFRAGSWDSLVDKKGQKTKADIVPYLPTISYSAGSRRANSISKYFDIDCKWPLKLLTCARFHCARPSLIRTHARPRPATSVRHRGKRS